MGALEAAAAEIVTVEASMEVAVEAAVMDPLGRAIHNKVQLHLLRQHRTSKVASIHRHNEHCSVKASRKHVKGGSKGWGSFLTALYLRYTRPDVSGSIVDFCLLPAAVWTNLKRGTTVKQYRHQIRNIIPGTCGRLAFLSVRGYALH